MTDAPIILKRDRQNVLTLALPPYGREANPRSPARSSQVSIMLVAIISYASGVTTLGGRTDS